MTDDIVKRLWRIADTFSTDNDLSDITIAANYIVRLRAEVQQLTADCIEELNDEIQQLKKKTNSVYNDWSDAICENSDLREKNAELKDEIDRLREALREVLHIADGYGSSSGRLAGIVLTASAAFEGEKTATMRTLVDKINQQAIAIAERDEFIEIMGMCNEFEEFLSK